MSNAAIEMFHAQTKAAFSVDLNAIVSFFAEDAVVVGWSTKRNSPRR